VGGTGLLQPACRDWADGRMAAIGSTAARHRHPGAPPPVHRQGASHAATGAARRGRGYGRGAADPIRDYMYAMIREIAAISRSATCACTLWEVHSRLRFDVKVNFDVKSRPAPPPAPRGAGRHTLTSPGCASQVHSAHSSQVSGVHHVPLGQRLRVQKPLYRAVHRIYTVSRQKSKVQLPRQTIRRSKEHAGLILHLCTMTDRIAR
jgi:hypothetical protein